MKKNYILSLACVIGLVLSGTNAFAQKYQKGDIILNPGIGLGYYYGTGSYANFAAGFSINAEFSCILDDIAIGPYFAITKRNYDYGAYDYDYTFIDFGARGTYHFGRLLKVKNENFDPYAGVFLGFVATSDNYDGNSTYDPYDGRAQGGVYAGARWFFTEKFGAFGEVGVGMYPIFMGITFKLK
jgi:hypothetical protein